VFGSTFGSMAQLAQGLLESDSNKRWLAPLGHLSVLMGLVLIVATTVEALAPFIYSIW